MIVVTGPTGHVGINLILKLLESGREVRSVVYETSAALDRMDVEQVRGDITDMDSLVDAFEGADVVYHLAARIDLTHRHRDLCEEININGTRNVVEACKRCGVRRLVYFSSIHAISPFPEDRPIDETRVLAGPPYLGLYDETKARAARLVQEADASELEAVILHPCGIIGPEDHQPSRMGRTIIDFARGKIPAVVEGGFSWVDVRDVCEAALQAEILGEPGQRFLLAGHWKSMQELGEEVARTVDVNPPTRILPRRVARGFALFPEVLSWIRGSEPQFSRYSIEALAHHQIIDASWTQSALGVTPRPFETTIRDTVEWHQRNGNLAFSG